MWPCLNWLRSPKDTTVKELDWSHCGLIDVPTKIILFERTLDTLNLSSNKVRSRYNNILIYLIHNNIIKCSNTPCCSFSASLWPIQFMMGNSFQKGDFFNLQPNNNLVFFH